MDRLLSFKEKGTEITNHICLKCGTVYQREVLFYRGAVVENEYGLYFCKGRFFIFGGYSKGEEGYCFRCSGNKNRKKRPRMFLSLEQMYFEKVMVTVFKGEEIFCRGIVTGLDDDKVSVLSERKGEEITISILHLASVLYEYGGSGALILLE